HGLAVRGQSLDLEPCTGTPEPVRAVCEYLANDRGAGERRGLVREQDLERAPIAFAIVLRGVQSHRLAITTAVKSRDEVVECRVFGREAEYTRCSHRAPPHVDPLIDDL